MLKFTKPIRLQKLQAMPAQPILVHLMKEAEKAPNRILQVAWPVQGSTTELYTLSCAVVTSKELIARNRQSGPIIPEWTLAREVEPEPGKPPSQTPPTQLWTHSTGDLGLLLNLITSEVSGVNQVIGDKMLDKTSTLGALNQAQKSFESQPTQANQFEPLKQTLATGEHQVFGGGQVTLAGDLANVDLPNIFQSIGLCKMSGRLNLYHRTIQAEVYFDDGVLVDAAAQSAVSGDATPLAPDQLVLELLTWEGGTFRFQPGWSSQRVTIKRRLESFILEGAMLTDYLKALENKGFSETSVLSRTDSCADEDVDDILRHGVAVDLDLQKAFYSKIGKGTPSQDLLGSLPRSKWAPIIFNLVNSGLVTIGGAAGAQAEKQVDPIAIDQSLVQNAFRSLMRPETGVITFPFFLYALQQEFARHKKVHHPFSLVLFDVDTRDKSATQQELDILIDCFAAMQAEFDLFAHFETLTSREFAILLPYRPLASAYLFVDKFAFSLRPHGVFTRANVYFGIAAMPHDGTDMNSLVSACTHAKTQAKNRNKLIATVRGIELEPWEELRQKGDLAVAQEQLDEASDIWLTALTEAEQFEQDDPRLLMTLDRLSTIYVAQRKPQMAEPLLKLAVDLRASQGDCTDTATMLDQLAKCFYEQKKFAEAEEAMYRSVQMCKALFGPEHDAVGSAFNNLATLYHMQDSYEKAKSAYERALQIKRKVLGREHPEAVRIAQNYAKLLSSQTHDAPPLGQQENPFITGTWQSLKLDTSKQ